MTCVSKTKCLRSIRVVRWTRGSYEGLLGLCQKLCTFQVLKNFEQFQTSDKLLPQQWLLIYSLCAVTCFLETNDTATSKYEKELEFRRTFQLVFQIQFNSLDAVLNNLEDTSLN